MGTSSRHQCWALHRRLRPRPAGHGQRWHAEEAARPRVATAHGGGRQRCVKDGGGRRFDQDLKSCGERVHGDAWVVTYSRIFGGIRFSVAKEQKPPKIILYSMKIGLATENTMLFSPAHSWPLNISLFSAASFWLLKVPCYFCWPT
jgi:hypothetical protein